MKIQEIFIKEESEVIREAVKNLPIEGCINKYFSYVDANGETDFEKKYINKLNNRFSNFISRIVKKTIETKTLEEMQDLYMDIVWDGFWSYENRDYYEIKDDIECYFKDKDLHEEIKKELSEALKELLEELHATKAEEEIKRLTALLQTRKDNMATYEKQKEQEQRLIEELEQKIQKIKEQGTNYAG